MQHHQQQQQHEQHQQQHQQEQQYQQHHQGQHLPSPSPTHSQAPTTHMAVTHMAGTMYPQMSMSIPYSTQLLNTPGGTHVVRYSIPNPHMMISGGRHKKEIKRRTKTGCLTCRKRRIKVSWLSSPFHTSILRSPVRRAPPRLSQLPEEQTQLRRLRPSLQNAKRKLQPQPATSTNANHQIRVPLVLHFFGTKGRLTLLVHGAEPPDALLPEHGPHVGRAHLVARPGRHAGHPFFHVHAAAPHIRLTPRPLARDRLLIAPWPGGERARRALERGSGISRPNSALNARAVKNSLTACDS
jgi:hypothetical protein